MTPARSQVVLLAGTVLAMGLSLGLTMLAGRTLAPAAFGSFALIATVLALGRELTDLGTGNLAARQAVRAAGAERAALAWLLRLRLRLTLLAAAAVAGYALLQQDAGLRLALLAAAPVVVLGHLGAYALVFQIRQAQLAPTLLHVAAQAAALIAAMPLALLGMPWLAWSALLLAREALQAGGTVWLARRLMTPLPRAEAGEAGGELLRGQAAAVAIATLALHLQVHGGILALNAFAAPEELGIFAAAQRPVVPCFVIPWLLALPLVPVLSWLAPRDREAFRRQACDTLDLAFGLGAIAAVAMAQLAVPVLTVLYGDRFLDGATDVLRWLGLAVGLTFPIAALSPILLAERAERPLMLLSVAGLLLNLLLLVLLVPGRGALAAGFAPACSLLVLVAGGCALAWWRAGLRPGLRSLAAFAPAALLWPALGLLPDPPLLRLLLGAVCVPIAALLLYLLPGLRSGRAEQASLAQQARATAHG